MKVAVELNGAAQMVQALNGAASKIQDGWRKSSYEVGARAVRLIKSVYRTGGTTSTTTAVRSGELRNAYDHTVTQEQGGVTLTVGLIRPTEGGHVPLHGRVLEGYDAAGNRVDEFVIKAKNFREVRRESVFGRSVRGAPGAIGSATPNPFIVYTVRLLTFRVWQGGGMAAKNAQWISKKEVRLKPRPALEPVGKNIPDALKVVCGAVFVQALTVGGTGSASLTPELNG